MVSKQYMKDGNKLILKTKIGIIGKQIRNSSAGCMISPNGKELWITYNKEYNIKKIGVVK